MATEIRFAFALNGGVSLAIWIGGVVDEVLRFVDAGRDLHHDGSSADPANPYVALCRELGVVPKVDVLTGSSAGGLNAAFLAAGVLHGCHDLHPIRELWIEHGSFDRLLRAPTGAASPSVLDGDQNFLPYIEEAFGRLAAAGTGYRDLDPPINVRLTATSLDGEITTIDGGHGEIYAMDHRVEFVFGNADFDFAHDERAIRRLARACRSTASFPGAFEPSLVPAELYAHHHVTGLFQDAAVESVYVVDGGVLVNLPAESAIDAIIAQPSRERIERVLALVVPDPGQPPGGSSLEPTLNAVVSKSVVGIPRTQSLTDFVRSLNAHNREVRWRRAGREALLGQFAGEVPAAAWAVCSTVAGALFPAYRSARALSSLDHLRLGLAARLETDGIDPAVWSSPDIDGESLPWVPRALRPGEADWSWGSATVRRLAAVLITGINTVAAVATDAELEKLYAIKERVAGAREEADRISPPRGCFAGLVASELKARPASLPEALDAAARRWPGGDRAVAISQLNAQLDALASALTDLVALARPMLAEPAAHGAGDVDLRPLAGLVNLHDGAVEVTGSATALLLCVEVIEASFAGSEPRPDQEIRLVQFTATGPVAFDELARSTADDKLAGVELGHFGAFLKRSWRANDWMWGRLDAAERLVALLDTILGGPLTRAGTLDAHKRAVQAEIVRQELPVVLRTIGEDEKQGGHVNAAARALGEAVRAAAGCGPHDEPDLSKVDEPTLRRLLAVDLVGSESLQQEADSNLTTMTSIAALATASAVVQSQGPRLLRRPIRLVGVSSSLAYRLSRRTEGGRFRPFNAAVAAVARKLGSRRPPAG